MDLVVPDEQENVKDPSKEPILCPLKRFNRARVFMTGKYSVELYDIDHSTV